MSRPLLFSSLVLALVVLAISPPTRGDFPKPSTYPSSWDLTITHSRPQRIIVQGPGDVIPAAYWYITYHVVNESGKDTVDFLPTFDLVTEDGRVIRSDTGIAPAVFDNVKQKEHIKYLMSNDKVTGDLHSGEDQSRDGVAIWREPDIHMGTFDIFASGFSGEATVVSVGGKDVTLRKTLQLTYHYSVDANDPSHGQLTDVNSQWVMR